MLFEASTTFLLTLGEMLMRNVSYVVAAIKDSNWRFGNFEIGKYNVYSSIITRCYSDMTIKSVRIIRLKTKSKTNLFFQPTVYASYADTLPST